MPDRLLDGDARTAMAPPTGLHREMGGDIRRGYYSRQFTFIGHYCADKYGSAHSTGVWRGLSRVPPGSPGGPLLCVFLFNTPLDCIIIPVYRYTWRNHKCACQASRSALLRSMRLATRQHRDHRRRHNHRHRHNHHRRHRRHRRPHRRHRRQRLHRYRSLYRWKQLHRRAVLKPKTNGPAPCQRHRK